MMKGVIIRCNSPISSSFSSSSLPSFLPLSAPQGRGSGFPGRRRSRGGGLGGGRGGRGRSRLKTQDCLTISPGVRKHKHTRAYALTHTQRGLTNDCFSPPVCVCGAVPAEGGGGELHAQHGGDVLHLRPLHPQTGGVSAKSFKRRFKK